MPRLKRRKRRTRKRGFGSSGIDHIAAADDALNGLELWLKEFGRAKPCSIAASACSDEGRRYIGQALEHLDEAQREAPDLVPRVRQRLGRLNRELSQSEWDKVESCFV